MTDHRPTVFLDTNVVLSYLEGRLPWLLGKGFVERFRYAINPIVLQEAVLHRMDKKHPSRLGHIMQETSTLPIDLSLADKILPSAREFRNKAFHSNDILIVSSAYDCDYFLTSDRSIVKLFSMDKPKVLTPDEFQQEVELQE